MKRSYVPVVKVFPSALNRRRGRLVAGGLLMNCALGRAGPTHHKREGDGASPVGRFALLCGFYRADRLRRPSTGLRLVPIRPTDGWCDDPSHPRYNTRVTLPFGASRERMWRDDHLYDLVLDIAWNRGPIVKGRGSAIFLHLARPGFAPTQGCVAVEPRMARRLLARVGRRTTIEIRG